MSTKDHRHVPFRLFVLCHIDRRLGARRPAHAAPPEGKGKPDHAGQGHGKNKDNRDSSGSVSVTLSTAGISISTARGYAGRRDRLRFAAARHPQEPGSRQADASRHRQEMVPGAMLARLPVHPGYEWRVAGSDLILVAIATSVVADVLSGVFD